MFQILTGWLGLFCRSGRWVVLDDLFSSIKNFLTHQEFSFSMSLVYVVEDFHTIDQARWPGKIGICLVPVPENIAAVLGGLKTRIIQGTDRLLEEIAPEHSSEPINEADMKVYDSNDPVFVQAIRAAQKQIEVQNGVLAGKLALHKQYQATLAPFLPNAGWYAFSVHKHPKGTVLREIPDGVLPMYKHSACKE